MSEKPKVIRLNPQSSMSPWEPMRLVGELAEGMQPQERFNRIHETTISVPCDIRAGTWEAKAYSERLDDYPYDEIVFVVEGSISIVDENGNDELFTPGECFFLQRGFNGYWNQHETLKIFHMTVSPRE